MRKIKKNKCDNRKQRKQKMRKGKTKGETEQKGDQNNKITGETKQK